MRNEREDMSFVRASKRSCQSLRRRGLVSHRCHQNVAWHFIISPGNTHGELSGHCIRIFPSSLSTESQGRLQGLRASVTYLAPRSRPRSERSSQMLAMGRPREPGHAAKRLQSNKPDRPCERQRWRHGLHDSHKRICTKYKGWQKRSEPGRKGGHKFYGN